MLGAPSTKQTGKRQEVKTAIHKGVLNLFNHVIHHLRSIGSPIQAFMANPTVRKSLTCRADPAKRNHGTEYFWTTSLLEAHSFGPHKGLCSQFLTLHKLAARAKLRDQLPAEAHAAEAAASRARVKTLWKALARNRSCTWPNPQNLTGTMHCSKVLNVANVHFYDHFVTMIS